MVKSFLKAALAAALLIGILLLCGGRALSAPCKAPTATSHVTAPRLAASTRAG